MSWMVGLHTHFHRALLLYSIINSRLLVVVERKTGYWHSIATFFAIKPFFSRYHAGNYGVLNYHENHLPHTYNSILRELRILKNAVGWFISLTDINR